MHLTTNKNVRGLVRRKHKTTHVLSVNVKKSFKIINPPTFFMINYKLSVYPIIICSNWKKRSDLLVVTVDRIVNREPIIYWLLIIIIENINVTDYNTVNVTEFDNMIDNKSFRIVIFIFDVINFFLNIEVMLWFKRLLIILYAWIVLYYSPRMFGKISQSK